MEVKRKGAAILAVGTLVFSLAACNASGASGNSGNSSASGNASAVSRNSTAASQQVKQVAGSSEQSVQANHGPASTKLGDITAVVTGIEQSTSVWQGPSLSKPSDIFDFVNVTLQNNGSKTVQVSDYANAVAKDSAGNTYNMRTTTMSLSEIGPGQSADCSYIFEVQKTSKLSEIEFTSNDGQVIGKIALQNVAVQQAAQQSQAQNGSIGKTVKVGSFELTVTGVSQENSAVGGLKPKAGNIFEVVSITLKNISSQSQDTSLLNLSSVKDSAGNTYQSSFATLKSQLNPNEQVQGSLTYEVPKSAKVTQLTIPDLKTGNVQATIKLG